MAMTGCRSPRVPIVVSTILRMAMCPSTRSWSRSNSSVASRRPPGGERRRLGDRSDLGRAYTDPYRFARGPDALSRERASVRPHLRRGPPPPKAYSPAAANVRCAAFRWGMSYILPSIPSVPASGCAAKASTIPLRLRDILRGGREAAVDDRYLIGMDRQPPGKAVAPRNPAGRLQPLGIAEIGVERVERRNPGGGGGEQTLRAGDLVGKAPRAVRILVGGRADRGGKILRAPGQSDQAGDARARSCRARTSRRGFRWRRTAILTLPTRIPAAVSSASR